MNSPEIVKTIARIEAIGQMAPEQSVKVLCSALSNYLFNQQIETKEQAGFKKEEK
ncbi:MAG TPA: hypothetical protein VNX65_02340 [Patescibacteria group bacterium]|jgi:hypothetical protein|nr:hypothetical protein [Patescibacteria group bacterium]